MARARSSSSKGDPPAETSSLVACRIGQDKPLGRLARRTKRILGTAQNELLAARPVEIVIETVDPQLRISRRHRFPCREIAVPHHRIAVVGRRPQSFGLRRSERRNSQRRHAQYEPDTTHRPPDSDRRSHLPNGQFNAASCSRIAAIFASASAFLARSFSTTAAGADCTKRSFESLRSTLCRNPS